MYCTCLYYVLLTIWQLTISACTAIMKPTKSIPGIEARMNTSSPVHPGFSAYPGTLLITDKRKSGQPADALSGGRGGPACTGICRQDFSFVVFFYEGVVGMRKFLPLFFCFLFTLNSQYFYFLVNLFTYPFISWFLFYKYYGVWILNSIFLLLNSLFLMMTNNKNNNI